jgi:hypothetical protein
MHRPQQQFVEGDPSYCVCAPTIMAEVGSLLPWCKCPPLLGCLQALLVQLVHRGILGCRLVAQIPQYLPLVYGSRLCRGGRGFVGFPRRVASQHFRLMPGRRRGRRRRSSRCGPRRRARSSGLRGCGSRKQQSASKSERGTLTHQQLHGHVDVLPLLGMASSHAIVRPIKSRTETDREEHRAVEFCHSLRRTALDRLGERLLKRIQPAAQTRSDPPTRPEIARQGPGT